MASLRVTFWIKPWFPLRQFPYTKPYWKVFNIKAQPLFTVRSETGSCTICQSRKVFSFNGALICFRFAACLSILLYKSFNKYLKVIANLLFPLNTTKKIVPNGTNFHTRGYKNEHFAMRSPILLINVQIQTTGDSISHFTDFIFSFPITNINKREGQFDAYCYITVGRVAQSV